MNDVTKPSSVDYDDLKYHDLSQIFPLIEGDEFEGFVEGFKKHGLLQQIILHEGKILEGRNRYRAVFYDPEERLIQINQRVPFTSDIVVKRTESKRALAKRDVDYFLRRLIPAISLHIAANVAANDWRNHVDAIAVNCWSRYFEKTTGKLKDAFVSSLKVEKKTILEMNIDRADALDAFRALEHLCIAPKRSFQSNLKSA
jgi:hypothetical protein